MRLWVMMMPSDSMERIERIRHLSRRRHVKASGRTASLLAIIAAREEALAQVGNDGCVSARRYEEATAALVAIASLRSAEDKVKNDKSSLKPALEMIEKMQILQAQLNKLENRKPNCSFSHEEGGARQEQEGCSGDGLVSDSDSDQFSVHELIRLPPSYGFNAPRCLEALSDRDLPAFLSAGLSLQANRAHAATARKAWLDLYPPDVFADFSNIFIHQQHYEETTANHQMSEEE